MLYRTSFQLHVECMLNDSAQSIGGNTFDFSENMFL